MVLKCHDGVCDHNSHFWITVLVTYHLVKSLQHIWKWVQLRFPWWRHQMETFSALLAICAGNSPHKGQWRGALVFSLICVRINSWVNNREAGDLRCHRAHYDVNAMFTDTGSFNTKMSFWYRNSHHKDRIDAKPSYLYDGSPYTWKDCLYIEMGPWFSSELQWLEK